MDTNHHSGAEHDHRAEHGEHKEPPARLPDIERKGNIMAVFAYLWVLIIIPFLTDAKDDPFVKYHLKQGLVLLIFQVIGWFVQSIPVIAGLIGWLFSLITIVLVIVGVLHVVNGEEKELPLIGHYAKNFSF